MRTSLFSVAIFLLPLRIYAQLDSVFLKPGVNGKDAFLASYSANTNWGNHQEFSAQAWTCNGDPCQARNLIEFDLSLIPSGVQVVSARLSLYANPVSLNGNGVAMNGTANQSVLQRVVEPWDESIVTWNSQPQTTSLHAVILSQSTDSFENYVGIDVTNLVSDILNNGNNYGFMLQMCNETYYNSMIFASSDYPEDRLHPSLTVVFQEPMRRAEISAGSISVYPNPCQDILNVSLKAPMSGTVTFQVTDLAGVIEKTENMEMTASSTCRYHINTQGLPKGAKILKVIRDNEVMVKRVIFE